MIMPGQVVQERGTTPPRAPGRSGHGRALFACALPAPAGEGRRAEGAEIQDQGGGGATLLTD